MKNMMEEIKNFTQEQKKQTEEQAKEMPEKQVVAGVVGKSMDDLEKNLPDGIKPDMVDKFLGNDNLWYWHLKPEYIKDEKEKQEYNHEREIWP